MAHADNVKADEHFGLARILSNVSRLVTSEIEGERIRKHGVTMAISQLSTVGPDDELNDLLTLRMDVLPALSANIGCRGSD